MTLTALLMFLSDLNTDAEEASLAGPLDPPPAWAVEQTQTGSR